MSIVFRLIDKALRILAAEAPNREQKFKAVREGLSCYYELYKEKFIKNTKQTKFYSYFKNSAEYTFFLVDMFCNGTDLIIAKDIVL